MSLQLQCYAEHAQRLNPSGRGSGRTTQAIIKAKSKILQGERVVFVAHNQVTCHQLAARHFPFDQGWGVWDRDTYKQFVRPIEVALISVARLPDWARGRSGWRVIVDHYVWEHLSNQDLWSEPYDPQLPDYKAVIHAVMCLERGL